MGGSCGGGRELHICAGPPVARMTLEATEEEEEENERRNGKQVKRRRKTKLCVFLLPPLLTTIPPWPQKRFCLRVKWLTGSELFFFSFLFYQSSSSHFFSRTF
jgi:hypothetical protein